MTDLSELIESLIYWTGVGVLLVGGWALIALLLWQAIELTLTLLRVKRLVVEYYWDRLKRQQGRVLEKKPAPPAKRSHL